MKLFNKCVLMFCFLTFLLFANNLYAEPSAKDVYQKLDAGFKKAGELVQKGKDKEAVEVVISLIETVSLIDNLEKQALTYDSIFQGVLRMGFVERAIDATDKIDREFHKSAILLNISQILANKDSKKSSNLLKQAQQVILTEEDASLKATVLSMIASTYLDKKMLKEAQELTDLSIQAINEDELDLKYNVDISAVFAVARICSLMSKEECLNIMAQKFDDPEHFLKTIKKQTSNK